MTSSAFYPYDAHFPRRGSLGLDIDLPTQVAQGYPLYGEPSTPRRSAGILGRLSYDSQSYLFGDKQFYVPGQITDAARDLWASAMPSPASDDLSSSCSSSAPHSPFQESHVLFTQCVDPKDCCPPPELRLDEVIDTTQCEGSQDAPALIVAALHSQHHCYPSPSPCSHPSAPPSPLFLSRAPSPNPFSAHRSPSPAPSPARVNASSRARAPKRARDDSDDSDASPAPKRATRARNVVVSTPVAAPTTARRSSRASAPRRARARAGSAPTSVHPSGSWDSQADADADADAESDPSESDYVPSRDGEACDDDDDDAEDEDGDEEYKDPGSKSKRRTKRGPVAGQGDEDGPYYCDHTSASGVCNWKLSRRSDLERHKRTVHKEGKFVAWKVTCPVCDRVMSRPDALQRHTHSSHKLTLSSTYFVLVRRIQDPPAALREYLLETGCEGLLEVLGSKPAVKRRRTKTCRRLMWSMTGIDAQLLGDALPSRGIWHWCKVAPSALNDILSSLTTGVSTARICTKPGSDCPGRTVYRIGRASPPCRARNPPRSGLEAHAPRPSSGGFCARALETLIPGCHSPHARARKDSTGFWRAYSAGSLGRLSPVRTTPAGGFAACAPVPFVILRPLGGRSRAAVKGSSAATAGVEERSRARSSDFDAGPRGLSGAPYVLCGLKLDPSEVIRTFILLAWPFGEGDNRLVAPHPWLARLLEHALPHLTDADEQTAQPALRALRAIVGATATPFSQTGLYLSLLYHTPLSPAPYGNRRRRGLITHSGACAHRSLAAEHLNEHLSFPAPELPLAPSTSPAAPPQPRQILKERLYVGNLHHSVDEGKPRGYAFVEYSDKADAEKALTRANDKILRGRKLVVTYANQAPLDSAAGLGLGARNRRMVSEVGKPTTLSLLKSANAGRSSDATGTKIARMEAKLRQLEHTDAPAASSSSSSSTRKPAHPSLPAKPLGASAAAASAAAAAASGSAGPVAQSVGVGRGHAGTRHGAPTNGYAAAPGGRARDRAAALPALPLAPPAGFKHNAGLLGRGAVVTRNPGPLAPTAAGRASAGRAGASAAASAAPPPTMPPTRAAPVKKAALAGVRIVKAKQGGGGAGAVVQDGVVADN
ncbi:uncharacterized protein BXZ73DRAFT_80325 [Epithele typhae]|uniref:uncharacterized protein n=1 Tax=Epithele typhae TaxID=378194 RepID=UPI002007E973|nr:uncharacterized protein BXZ73DRAFT_80325 [Epithele typhae]KAH9919451.1 hypothetical protein BXZ73DRAFT_80325 [Epithele typhae]